MFQELVEAAGDVRAAALRSRALARLKRPLSEWGDAREALEKAISAFERTVERARAFAMEDPGEEAVAEEAARLEAERHRAAARAELDRLEAEERAAIAAFERRHAGTVHGPYQSVIHAARTAEGHLLVTRNGYFAAYSHADYVRPHPEVPDPSVLATSPEADALMAVLRARWKAEATAVAT